MCHPHGMGNPPSDLPELAGLLQVLAADSRPHPLVLAGHKASFGHSVCAAGLISVMVSTLALQHALVPVHLGVVNVVSILQQAHERVLLPSEDRLQLTHATDSDGYASVSGTSVSGDNVHLVLEHVALSSLRSASELRALGSTRASQVSSQPTNGELPMPETTPGQLLAGSPCNLAPDGKAIRPPPQTVLSVLYMLVVF